MKYGEDVGCTREPFYDRREHFMIGLEDCMIQLRKFNNSSRDVCFRKFNDRQCRLFVWEEEILEECGEILSKMFMQTGLEDRWI